MTKTIDTLVADIYEVVNQNGGWDATVSSFFSDRLASTVTSRLEVPTEERTPGLRMSSMGQPCHRKLWYGLNNPEEQGELQPSTRLKFLFGDILEDLLIALAKAAGHTVTGEQDVMMIGDIKGHRDCVIDGVTVDVKSAATFSFQKFKNNELRENDPFGYISQLSSYVYAAKDDPLVTDKHRGAFLVMDKQHGHLCLDMYDMTPEVLAKEAEFKNTKAIVLSDTVPPRAFEPVADGASGNMKLPTNCSYCDFKKLCHPGVRTFVYSNGPKFLTKVGRLPKVPEVE